MVDKIIDSRIRWIETELKHARKLCELQARFLRKSDRVFSEANPSERLIRLPELLRLTGLSKRTIYRFEAAGRFPRRRHLGLRAVGWPENEVKAWTASPTGWKRTEPALGR